MGWLQDMVDKVTPWNTQSERNQNAENKRLQDELNARLELQKKQAGIMDDNTLESLKLAASSKMYMIIGFSLVLIVGIVAFMKFGKK